MLNLNPEKAYIFRIVHIDNVPWILEHGIHCRSAKQQDPNYVEIGSPGLIGKRATFQVPLAPGGTLSDYVPFYFTPHSIMMCNIHTGYNVRKRPNDEIVIFVTSMHRIAKRNHTFLFTNQHAYAAGTDFYNDLKDLKEIDWALLRRRDFRTDDADPGKQLRYQAEALVHRHVPLDSLLGIACDSEATKKKLAGLVSKTDVTLDVKALPDWYFR